MKYEVSRNDEGHTVLQLGLNHVAEFEPQASVDDVVLGVTLLIEKVVGVQAFELAKSVLVDLGRINEDGTIRQDG